MLNLWNTAAVCNGYDAVESVDTRDSECTPIWIIESARLTQDANYPWLVSGYNIGRTERSTFTWRVPSIHDSALWGYFAA